MLLRLKSRSFGFGTLIAVELIYIGIVSLLFFLLAPPVAGVVAGFGFLILGISVMIFAFRGPNAYSQASLWAATFYLVIAVIPILATRILNWGADFKEMKILGVHAPEFHKISGTLYMGLLAATIVDFLRALKK